MKNLRKMANLAVAGGLMLGAWSMGLGQQGSGNRQGLQQPHQAQTGVPPQTQNPAINAPFGDATPPSNLMESMAVQRNTDRQKKLVLETDMLLRMATELKVDVDRSDKNMLSVDVVKKADEMEKLARNVKDGMKAN